jgi:putative oxidoreductase
MQIHKKRELLMSSATNHIERLYTLFVKLMSNLESPFLLAVRLYWGWQFAMIGWGKLHNLAHVTEFFQSLRLPAPAFTATFVSSFEFLAGILLAVGLLSRITALGIVIDMSVAYLTADHDALVSIFSSPDKFYGADPFIFWFVGLVVLSVGPGNFSLDTLLSRFVPKKRYNDTELGVLRNEEPGLRSERSEGESKT